MEKRIHIANYALNVLFIGNHQSNSNKPILVFLHEALGSIPQWKSFPTKLCQSVELAGMIIERRGHGKSDPLDAPRTNKYLHNYTYELKEVLNELLPLNQSFILVGHSDGGTIALLFATLFPKNLLALITMAAHTFVEPETIAGIEPTVQAYEQGKLIGLSRIHGDKTDTLFYAWANTWRSIDFISWDIRNEIGNHSIPTRVIQGTMDQFGTIKQVESITQHLKKATALLIPNCGHHPHLYKETEVIENITEFIQPLLS